MNQNSQKITDFFNRLDEAFKVYVPAIIAESATEYYKERFTKKEWDGHSWPETKKKIGRGSLMVRSGKLQSSIRPSSVTPDRVIISAGSSKVPYARIHNEGLRVRSVQYVKPHHNNNFMGKGKRVQIHGFARKVDYTMPRRQFMGHSTALDNIIINRIKKEFKSHLK